MIKEIELNVHPDFINDHEVIKSETSKKLKLNLHEITAVQIIKKSIDARSRMPIFKIRVLAFINEKPTPLYQEVKFQHVKSIKRVIVVGSGPAGLFASLRLITHNIKPIVLERGKDVQSRRRELREIQKFHNVNPESNYCFGEGGAGTYSDGKLYTRSTKRGNTQEVLNLLVQHGAVQDILIDAHPHIGSNKLPKVVQAIRETIINNGGEFRFDSKVTDFIKSGKEIKGVIVNDKEEIFADAVILATGHSARDIYYLLDKNEITIEPKEFAMGVRIEHPQPLIDSLQYHMKVRHENLPASSYNLNCQIDDRGVYSFCMCPGGIIIPASTDKEELVLNGMSVSRRDSPFANSGLVVSIKEEDWKDFESHGVFAGLEYQKYVEKIAFNAGGKSQTAPAQRITDFVNGKLSNTLPKTSYIPGTITSPLHEILPNNISKRLRESLNVFGKKMKGYYTEEAQILAAETRTSSPIRIPRDKDTLEHTTVKNLYPCGEGAGYAGGIVSAAIDGQRVADAIANKI
ncbi:MAG: FAD-dependent oxidoreductase [Melioribacteraceae bacterium]|nr:FAD-dependent oxidoreductase [Melioribacteraceae bacterium]